MGGRKRQNLTLDLNSASPKKNKVQNLLTSPDVQMLKLPPVSDGGADDVRQGVRGGAGEDQIPGELRSHHGHRDGGQHSGDPELWSDPAGASVSPSPPSVSAQPLPLPHRPRTKQSALQTKLRGLRLLRL